MLIQNIYSFFFLVPFFIWANYQIRDAIRQFAKAKVLAILIPIHAPNWPTMLKYPHWWADMKVM